MFHDELNKKILSKFLQGALNLGNIIFLIIVDIFKSGKSPGFDRIRPIIDHFNRIKIIITVVKYGIRPSDSSSTVISKLTTQFRDVVVSLQM